MPLKIRVYLHSCSCCCLRDIRNHAKFAENFNLQQFIVIQGHQSSCRLKAHVQLPSHLSYKLNGTSSSLVLTATHHSCGNLAWLSDFFDLGSGVRLPTGLRAKWLERRVFTQGCASCTKNRFISYPMISRAPKRWVLHNPIFSRFVTDGRAIAKKFSDWCPSSSTTLHVFCVLWNLWPTIHPSAHPSWTTFAMTFPNAAAAVG